MDLKSYMTQEKLTEARVIEILTSYKTGRGRAARQRSETKAAKAFYAQAKAEGRVKA